MTDNLALKKALFSIKKLKQQLQERPQHTIQPIAITGLSCRFPGALNKDEYWKLLCKGKNIITKIPDERWALLSGTDEINLRDESHPYWGGYLPDINLFDAYFFGITPREAIPMDPQQRLLLEVSYEALEDAGLPLEQIAGTNMGVFASLYISQLAHLQRIESDLDALYLPTGNVLNMAPNRISYLFDLHGPSFVVDSSCSSSMVALHLACLNLQNNLCDSALVCAARLNILPYINYVLTKATMLSPDGQCKTFDAHANGYALGEGVGAIILKPLDKALKDKDRIYAVISASAVNQDGKTNGLTAPNGLAQEALLKSTYKVAQIDPQNVSYVECHGTGTFLGDPIEVQSLGEAISKNRTKENPCWIGSVKTNIGHLEHAAGISSIIKAALVLNYATIPPHLNVTELNPHIKFDKYHFKIPKQIEPMPKYGSCRIASVSGFGFGGTSAHAVMCESPVDDELITLENKPELFTLSAKDFNALKKYIDCWCIYLEINKTASLSQLCYCMHVKRSHYSHRLAIIASTTEELYTTLINLQQSNLEKMTNTDKIYIGSNKNKTKYTPLDINNLDQLALSYVNFNPIDWRKLEATRHYQHIDLPLYPWQHKNYWPSFNEKQRTDSYPLQAKKIISPLNSIQFQYNISTQHLPDLQDTRHIMHVGYYLEILAYAIDNLFQRQTFTVTNLSFSSPLMVPNNSEVIVHLILDKIDNNIFAFNFYSHSSNQGSWVLHAKGHISPDAQSSMALDSIDQIKSRCGQAEKAETLYQRVNSMGIPTGDSIRWTQQYWLNNNEMLSEFRQPNSIDLNSKFKLNIHPSIFDGSLQPLFMFLPQALSKPYIATSIDKITYHGIKSGPLYWLGKLKNPKSINEFLSCDYYLMNQDNEIIVECLDVRLTPLNSKIDISKITNFKSQDSLDLTSLSTNDRRNQIVHFLIERTADIFSMPKEDINADQPLSDLGIDSLMGLILTKDIETALGEIISLQTILQGVTINELTDLILKQPTEAKQIPTTSEPSIELSTPWIAYRKPKSNAKIRLFCFPFGGAGASTYIDWQNQLPDTIEVCPVQLPGRENRIAEPNIMNIDQLIDELFNNLKPLFTLPFAFFGHSMGSLLAFELTRRLRREQHSLPKYLFISAFHDPALPPRSLDNLLSQLNNANISYLSNLNDLNEIQFEQLTEILIKNGIIEFNTQTSNNKVIKSLLPTFISDITSMKEYHYKAESPLNIPINIFVGKCDTWVTYEEHLGWTNYTSAKTKFYEFDGGHLFIKDKANRSRIFNIISEQLKDYLLTSIA